MINVIKMILGEYWQVVTA